MIDIYAQDIKLQDVFEFVCRHLFEQSEKAQGRDAGNIGMCMYRAPDGKKCAVGCLIPDSEYKPSFEGHTVLHLTSTWHTMPEWMRDGGPGYTLLKLLQTVHDKTGWLSTQNMRDQLTKVGLVHGLEVDFLSTLSLKWDPQ